MSKSQALFLYFYRCIYKYIWNKELLTNIFLGAIVEHGLQKKYERQATASAKETRNTLDA